MPGSAHHELPVPPAGGHRQTAFADLGTPLRDATFVVVDLETTGGSAESDAITEIGAVKVRGGEVLGEFQTLVRPATPIPPFIQALTGITDRMVADAPGIAAALPAFLEFVGTDAVLVAHNAPFDLGFLRAAAKRLELPWHIPGHLDTARIARRVLNRDEAPNCKLATLARLFRATTTPNHRALSDARATVDVLHGLMERVGNDGVTTLEELQGYTSRVPAEVRSKRTLADRLPHAAGVYWFCDHDGRVLYIGTSVNLRSRVRSYFTAAEQRRRVQEMVKIAERVDFLVCATPLEARIRELRLIAEHKPPYNRRSKFPERALWLRLTDEALPRLSVVRQITPALAAVIGPYGGRNSAESAAAALLDAVPLRQCTQRLSPRRPATACVLAGMGRCGAPCDGSESPAEYASHVAVATQVMAGDPGAVVVAARARMARLMPEQRYEEAAAVRDRVAAYIRGTARAQRLRALIAAGDLLAARPQPTGGWELLLIRNGRFAGAESVPGGVAVRPHLEALRATAAVVPASFDPLTATAVEEAEELLRFLNSPGTRLVAVSGTWVSPVRGAAAYEAEFAVPIG